MGKQLSFFGNPAVAFGGSLLKGNPKVARPLSVKNPIHLVLRADKSRFRLPKNFARANECLEKTAKKHGVRVYQYANVGNHFHVVLRILNRRQWAGFIRELTSRLAYMAQIKWPKRPFTRIVAGGRRAYQALKNYIQLNELEGSGLISRPQATQLSRQRQAFADG